MKNLDFQAQVLWTITPDLDWLAAWNDLIMGLCFLVPRLPAECQEDTLCLASQSFQLRKLVLGDPRDFDQSWLFASFEYRLWDFFFCFVFNSIKKITWLT